MSNNNRTIKFRALVSFGYIPYEWVYYSPLEVPKEIVDAEHIEVKDLEFTGLKDKNGKEIYEGDIVGYANESIVSVVRIGEYYFNGHEYTVAGCGVYLERYENGDKEGMENGLHSFPNEEDEVIGNIYENPELLKDPSEGGKRI